MSPTGTRRGRSAFTLIELLVVLVALVVLAAMVVPTLHGAGRQGDLDGTAARVAASARFARETAMAQGVTIGLIVETAPDAVQLVVDEEEASFGQPAFATVAGPPGSARRDGLAAGFLPGRFARVRLPAGVTAHLEPAEDTASVSRLAGSPTDMLRFPPDGRTDGGVIVLSDARGRERRVLVVPGTGRVATES